MVDDKIRNLSQHTSTCKPLLLHQLRFNRSEASCSHLQMTVLTATYRRLLDPSICKADISTPPNFFFRYLDAFAVYEFVYEFCVDG